ncbi:MAG: hypothetical protein AAGA48_35565 [Myxococcota bacterium]
MPSARLLAFAFATIACAEEEIQDNPTLPLPSNTTTPTADEGFEPTHVGFDIRFGIDEGGNMVSFGEPGGEVRLPLIVIQFASIDYLQGKAPEQMCFFLAAIPEEQRTPLLVTEHFPNRDDAPMHQAYQFSPETWATDCNGRVNAALFGADAMGLLERWDDATFELGFAPLEANGALQEFVDGLDEPPETLNSLFVEYLGWVDEDSTMEADALNLGQAIAFDPMTGEYQLEDGNFVLDDVSERSVQTRLTSTFYNNLVFTFLALDSL